VRFCDSTTRLAVLRVPREFCSIIRCALTFLTVINKRRVALTVDSIHGCSRTAKVQTIRKVKRIWRQRFLKTANNDDISRECTAIETKNGPSQKVIDRNCRSIEGLLKDVLSMGN
jgi:Rpp14/Pop5 family